MRGWGVLFEETAVEVLEEFGLRVGDEVENFEEGGDGVCWAFMVLLPLEEESLERVVGVSCVEGGEELLRRLLHLLGGQHLYN